MCLSKAHYHNARGSCDRHPGEAKNAANPHGAEIYAGARGRGGGKNREKTWQGPSIEQLRMMPHPERQGWKATEGNRG